MLNLRGRVLTAKARSKTLKDHLEAFLSVNRVDGREPSHEEQLNFILSKLMDSKVLKLTEIHDYRSTAMSLKEVRENFKHAEFLDYLAKTIGYLNYSEMVSLATGPFKRIVNLNYGKQFVAVNTTISETYLQKKELFDNLSKEIFNYVRENDFESLSVRGYIGEIDIWINEYVEPIIDEILPKVNPVFLDGVDITHTVITNALTVKYGKKLKRETWRKCFKHISTKHYYTSSEVRKLSIELMGVIYSFREKGVIPFGK